MRTNRKKTNKNRHEKRVGSFELFQCKVALHCVVANFVEHKYASQ